MPPAHGKMRGGSGTWRNIQDDASVVYVDPSYVGGSSDGTQAQPFTSINAALAALVPGARIALAAGPSDEAIALPSSVTLEGRCPSMVHLTNTKDTSTISLKMVAQVAVRGVHISGAGVGIDIDDASDITIEHVHIQGAHGAGVQISGASMALIDSSFIEGTLLDGE